jgi:hypothetical protein
MQGKQAGIKFGHFGHKGFHITITLTTHVVELTMDIHLALVLDFACQHYLSNRIQGKVTGKDKEVVFEFHF